MIDDTKLVSFRDGWRGRIYMHRQSSPLTVEEASTAEWLDFLDRLITSPAKLPQMQRLKLDADAQVIQAVMDRAGRPRAVVCKYSRACGIRARVSGWLRGSRASRNADRATALLGAGINTASPLAWLERRWPAPESWLVCEFVPALIDVDHIALRELPRLSPCDARRAKDRLIDAITELLVRLTSARLSHRDFKASNILVTRSEEPSRYADAWLLDLDGLTQRWARDLTTLLRPVVRLTASLSQYATLTRTDLARLLKRLVPLVQGGANGWREAFRIVSTEAVKYTRAARTRKKDKLDGFGAEGAD
jgi:hypothetical protein